MSNKIKTAAERVGAIKNESTRQRWDLFHRAITHAKASNESSLDQSAEPRTVSFESLAS